MVCISDHDICLDSISNNLTKIKNLSIQKKYSFVPAQLNIDQLSFQPARHCSFSEAIQPGVNFVKLKAKICTRRYQKLRLAFRSSNLSLKILKWAIQFEYIAQ